MATYELGKWHCRHTWYISDTQFILMQKKKIPSLGLERPHFEMTQCCHLVHGSSCFFSVLESVWHKTIGTFGHVTD